MFTLGSFAKAPVCSSRSSARSRLQTLRLNSTREGIHPLGVRTAKFTPISSGIVLRPAPAPEIPGNRTSNWIILVQKPIEQATVRHSWTVRSVFRVSVTLQNRDLFEEIGKDARCAEACDASTNYQCAVHPVWHGSEMDRISATASGRFQRHNLCPV